ncbi:MAG: PD-(D/E)XK nuclease family transposase [Desulfamplus sp.]|nr:PD-(D/E)XK nuclease family transposase [Desulfamplus sp.]
MADNPVRLIRFDWAIKSLLRDKSNFDVLEGFLAALLEDENIKILNLLESEGNQSHADDKFNRVDLMVEDSLGRKIIIEIQNTRETDYLERLLFGTSKVIVENQKLGEDFSSISKVISVSILYFNLGTGDDYLYKGTTRFLGMNTGTPLHIKRGSQVIENLKPGIRFITKDIFPEYYFIQVHKFPDVITRFIDEWIYMIKHEEIKDDFSSKNIDKAREKLAWVHMSRQEKAAYDRYLINLARERNIMETAAMDGMEMGIKKIAMKMIVKGEPMEKISEFTELSIDEIQSLQSMSKAGF